MSLPKPLMFTVGLIDQITKPIAHISKEFNQLGANYQKGTMQMMAGAAGVAASGMTLYTALKPALDIDRALGNAKGVGVADSALKQITATAFDFSLQYGKSATDVINHAEKLRGVMGEMPDHILVSTTKSSAILAMAMQSDVDTVAKYFKNLYGNYSDEAALVGVDNFFAKIAGMTAHAKKQFGTNIDDMEGMIEGMHSLTSSLGVSMEEQFAVLSMLGQQMGQGDAVTQYTNYLENIVAAQDKLGVKLTDVNGRRLPLVETLERLQPLLRNKSDDQIWKILDDAGLGDGSLMITKLIKDIDKLKGNISSYQDIKGLDPAINMAKSMTDQLGRLEQSWFVIRAAVGSVILPAFNEVVGGVADMGKEVLWFTDMFPNLTKYLSYAAVGVLGLVAAGGLLTMTWGMLKMSGAGLMLIFKGIKGIGTGLLWVKKSLTLASLSSAAATVFETSVNWGMVVSTKAVSAAIWTASIASKACAVTTGILSGAFGILRTVIWSVTAAVLANPIVFAIGAATVAVGALIYYWDDLKATVSDWGWVQGLVGFFSDAWLNIKNMAIDGVNSVIDMLNKIPSVDIDLIPNVSKQTQPTSAVGGSSIPALVKPKLNLVPGGITNQIANANNQKSTSIGNVNVYPAKGETNFMNFVEMHS